MDDVKTAVFGLEDGGLLGEVVHDPKYVLLRVVRMNAAVLGIL